jgi:hypothetical protein
VKDLEKAYHLGSRLGAVLDRLIAERPDLGWTEVAALFTAATGREINPATVARRYRRKSGTSSRFLTDEQREVLLRLCQDAAPDYPPGEVAAAFTRATGRPLGQRTVGRFMRKYLDVPPGRFGRKPGPKPPER